MSAALEFRLLNDFQRDFPLCPAPYSRLAARLGVGESVVLAGLKRLRGEGKISRVGPVFAPRRIGASTLAAMAVPAARLDAVAETVSRFPQVNHNYQREHRFNLWFVVTAGSAQELTQTLAAIEGATACPLLSLPLLEAFYIDLGFPLDGSATKHHGGSADLPPPLPLGEQDRRLVAALQSGLALQSRPFADVAAQIGTSEAEVIERIGHWLEIGAIKRFGVVVRHHELGYTANAMLVHDIPDDRVGEIGRALAREAAVTLCYRRPRRLPDWPYNLFCMIHGQNRATVEAAIEALRQQHGLESHRHAVLFSTTRFKQQGACYA